MVVVLLVGACTQEPRPPPAPRPSRPESAVGNVLVILMDDVGRDKVAAYGDHPRPPVTPRLDALAAEGMVFRTAYATPLCSPTRAALLTGRYPSRTGIGHLVEVDDPVDHLANEDGLPAMLHRSPTSTWTTALVGKWHLGATKTPNTSHPATLGFDAWSGSLNNLPVASIHDRKARNYTHWEKNTDGDLAYTDTYATLDTTDDAILAVRTMPEPWFVLVAYNAAHTPLHDPPADLHPCSPTPGKDKADLLDAMVESLDTEIGRLLDNIDAEVLLDTTVVVMGDNGTAGESIRPPWPDDRKKGTMSEASVRVPLIVTGPLVGVPGSESNALVHVVDLFPTAAEIAGVDLNDGIVRDGTSLVPLLRNPDDPGPRTTLFTEKFTPNGVPDVRSLAIRDRTHKLVVLEGLPDELFDLRTDRWSEGPNLLLAPLSDEAQDARTRLRGELDRILATFPSP